MDVDHTKQNKFDNRIAKLREASRSDNNRNKLKKKNSKSKYYGVFKHTKLWLCLLKINDKRYGFYYENELHAAYHYDLLLIEHKLKFNPIK